MRHLLQPRVLADDLRRAAALRELVLEQDVLGRQPALRERALDQQQQVIGIDRLGEEVERAFLHRRDRVLDAAERRHHDDRQLRVEFLGRAQDAEAVALGQPQVGQDHAGAAGAQRRIASAWSRASMTAWPCASSAMAEHRAQRVLVLDEQDRRDRPDGARGTYRSQPAGTPSRRASSSSSGIARRSSLDDLLQAIEFGERLLAIRADLRLLRRIVAVHEIGRERIDPILKRTQEGLIAVELFAQRRHPGGPVRLVLHCGLRVARLRTLVVRLLVAGCLVVRCGVWCLRVVRRLVRGGGVRRWRRHRLEVLVGVGLARTLGRLATLALLAGDVGKRLG